jgi:hypothetical protein
MSNSILDVGDKLTVGQFDFSIGNLSSFAIPGTTVLNGPCFIGVNASPGVTRASCMIGPTLLGNPNSLESIGITNFYGSFNSFSLNTFTGLSNVFGVVTKFALSLKHGVDIKNALNNANGPSVCNASLSVFGPMTTPFIRADVGEFTVSLSAPGKHFNIPHPSKPGHRLVHACLEGPEYGVYFRGRLIDKTYIELPKFWDNLIDPESITVHFTPRRIYQELYVKSIEWGKIIHIANNLGGPIDCDYVVYAERKDIDKLVIEYEGENI